MPEEDGPEHHRGIDYAVILPPVGVVSGLVNGVNDQDNGDKNNDQYENADHPVCATGIIGAVAAVIVQIAQTVAVHIELVQLHKQVEDTVAILAALDIRLERAV